MVDDTVARAARSSARWAFVLALAVSAGACESDPVDGPPAGTSGTGGTPVSGAGAGGAAGSAPPGGTGGLMGAGAGGAAGVAGTAGGGGMAGMAAAGAGGTAAPGAPTFSAIFSEILTRGSTGNCMFGACHGGEPNPMLNGNLRIAYDDKQGAYDNLVGKVSDSMLCAGMPLVVRGDSQGSLLIKKFSETPPCGARMPIGNPLTAAHVAQIATWIDNGAMND